MIVVKYLLFCITVLSIGKKAASIKSNKPVKKAHKRSRIINTSYPKGNKKSKDVVKPNVAKIDELDLKKEQNANDMKLDPSHMMALVPTRYDSLYYLPHIIFFPTHSSFHEAQHQSIP